MDTLNYNFVKSAEKITAFNICSSSFRSLDYKKEIQYLFKKHFFPEFDLSNTLNIIKLQDFNSIVSQLKSFCSISFNNLYNYNVKGIGPGEISMYFTVDSAVLGGGSSAGVDLIDNSGEYEIKAVSITSDGFAKDFKLGGTVPLSGVISEINYLKTTMGLESPHNEIPKSIINQIKIHKAKEYKIVEKEFALNAANYFKDHRVIFMNNYTKSKLGTIESIQTVKENQIFIDRITSGTVKPLIKLEKTND